jgi:hypothetical protein
VVLCSAVQCCSVLFECFPSKDLGSWSSLKSETLFLNTLGDSPCAAVPALFANFELSSGIDG